VTPSRAIVFTKSWKMCAGGTSTKSTWTRASATGETHVVFISVTSMSIVVPGSPASNRTDAEPWPAASAPPTTFQV